MKSLFISFFMSFVFLLFVSITPVSAEDAYVGGSVGSVDYEGDDAGTGFKLYGGLEIDDVHSVEAGYADLGAYSESFAIPFFGTTKFTASAWALYVDGIARVALDSEKKLNAFGKLGLALYDSEAKISSPLVGSVSGDESGIALKYGIGISYDIDEKISVRAEFENYDVDFDAEFLSIGLTMAL